ncbi:hypothetical protein [Sphingomonas sp. IBVSS2]|uniref:hypothetical protein n=1 Tax=Sphingomonas sp. IBVSS2 TaxID=1985172 RepID=UPI0015C5053E|nr:hypothetical protein [Sphingomonas sp. IBVSS2]
MLPILEDGWFTGHLRGKLLDQIDRLIDKHIQRSDRIKDLYEALIRAIFRRVMREWEWTDRVPAFKNYSRGGKVRVRWITEEQAERLLKELPEHQRDVVVFALATGLRQSDVPTWVLQELGGWMSESMVRRYAHMSVKHLQPYADQLTFVPKIRDDGEAQKTAEADGAKSPTAPRRDVLILASQDGARC